MSLNLNLYEILPEELSDAEAARLANIFMEVALAIENHYYAQIRRHLKTISEASEESPSGDKNILERERPRRKI